jgi:branched-chain amino acid transport system ATP-binding protein
MSTCVLDIEQLRVAYGSAEAVRGVSLHVTEGEIVTVIGANGAGKTTLLNGIMGALPATGSVTFLDRPLSGLAVEDRVRLGLNLVPESRELFSTLSVEDNLRLGAFRFRGRPQEAAAAALEEVYTIFPRLKERRSQPARTLSGGERQMLAMGRALMSEPRLLMLDEPSLGLAPLVVRDIFQVVRALRDKGVAILLVEQNARAALDAASRGYVLEGGICTLTAPSAELRADKRVIESYLGLRAATD